MGGDLEIKELLMKKVLSLPIPLFLVLVLGAVTLVSLTGIFLHMSHENPGLADVVTVTSAASLNPDYFHDSFDRTGQLTETGSMSGSASPDYWVNSGAFLIYGNGRGGTLQGELAVNDPWRIIYSRDNPGDTDGGYHPQNIFRLVTRSSWQDVRQEATFTIARDNLSSSSERYDPNGILFFNRYVNSDNLYYTGLRVDGYAVIKKKQQGSYSTLAYNRVFPGTYNRSTNPSLLPKNTPIGLRSEVTNQADGSVLVKLWADVGKTGSWTLVAQATDRSSPITASGYAGIRTDFMDVWFDDYSITNLSAPPPSDPPPPADPPTDPPADPPADPAPADPPSDPVVVAPHLALQQPAVSWASLADYRHRDLTVDWPVSNTGGVACASVVTKASNNQRVTLVTTLPYQVGDIGSDSTVHLNLKYHVPQGVSSWKARLVMETADSSGQTYVFPESVG